MSTTTRTAEIAALIGDPSRTNILTALMDGRALTAKELAYAAHITPQTASGHLASLTAGNLLTAEKQGRHRYFRLASPLVGQMLESIMAVATAPTTWRGSEALRTARTCYDHLAGRLGVALTDALTQNQHLTLTPDGGELTPTGQVLLQTLGITPPSGTRIFCRPCLDWSERRPHIAGRLGAAIATRCLDLHWVERQKQTRALTITPAGVTAFQTYFGITLT